MLPFAFAEQYSLQSQKAVFADLKSKQILPFVFAEQYALQSEKAVFAYFTSKRILHAICICRPALHWEDKQKWLLTWDVRSYCWLSLHGSF